MKSEEDSSLPAIWRILLVHPQLHLMTRPVATDRPYLRHLTPFNPLACCKQAAPTALSVGDSLYFQPRSGDMFVVRSA